MSRQPDEVLRDALTHLTLLQRWAVGNLNDQLVVDAVCMRLSAGIEVLATLDAELRDALFGNDWPLMWGMRNRIAHGYLLVDTAIIRETVHRDVPIIMARIQGHLDGESIRRARDEGIEAGSTELDW